MLASWKKSFDQLSILKSRDITLPTNVHLVKAMIFSVVTYACDSWTIKNTECQRIDAFELWCWRRLLRVPWTAWRFNQSVLKEMSPEYSLEELMLKVKLQYFAHMMWSADSLGKTKGRMTEDEMAGWHHWLNGHELAQALGGGGGEGILACWSPWGHKESDTTEWLNWTELKPWWETCLILSPWDLYIEKKFKPLLNRT